MSTTQEAAVEAIQEAQSLLFVGNATTVIRYGGFTLLTDPNFLHRGQYAYLGHGLVSRRRTEPACSVAQLPELDAVVLSHLHGDHWDRVARRGLDRGLPIVTTPHASRRLQGWHGFRRAVGLRTWDSHTLVKDGRVLRVTATPGRHGPGRVAALLPPVMGSVLEFGDGDGAVDLRVYVSGDTLMVDELHEIPRRFPDVDLALVHLGGTTLLRTVMVTMDGRQGADLLDLVRPAWTVPIHVDDYTVFRSPLSDFEAELARRGGAHRMTVVRRGDTVGLARGERPGTT